MHKNLHEISFFIFWNRTSQIYDSIMPNWYLTECTPFTWAMFGSDGEENMEFEWINGFNASTVVWFINEELGPVGWVVLADSCIDSKVYFKSPFIYNHSVFFFSSEVSLSPLSPHWLFLFLEIDDLDFKFSQKMTSNFYRFESK